MRTAPSSIDTSSAGNYYAYTGSSSAITGITAVTLDTVSTSAHFAYVRFTKTSGFTNAAPYWVVSGANNAYLGFNSEL